MVPPVRRILDRIRLGLDAGTRGSPPALSDRGFVLSDHVDWPSLLAAIEATGAGEVWVTHGYTAVVVRWLQEHGVDARAVQTRFEGELEEMEQTNGAEEAGEGA